jgi:hypothetical protein
MNAPQLSLAFAIAFTLAAPPAQADFLELQEVVELGVQVAAAGDGLGTALDSSGETLVAGANTDGGGDAAYVFLRSAGTWTQQAMLQGPDTLAGDDFGDTVSVDGDTVVVGAPCDDTGAGAEAGSAYVFVRSGTVWSFQQQLLASDAAADDRFATNVSVSGDTILVGAPRDDDLGNLTGSAYVFVRSGTTWSEQAKLLAPDGLDEDRFGSASALDGDTALLGAPFDDTVTGTDAGSVYAFVRSGTTWSFQDKLIQSSSSFQFGRALDLGGDRALIGEAPGAWSYTRSGSVWSLEQELPGWGNDGDFGAAVTFDGGTALVGAPLSCAVFLYTYDGALWNPQDRFTATGAAPQDELGSGVALAGSQALLGAPRHDAPVHDAGAVYITDIATGTGCVSPDFVLVEQADSVSVSVDTAALGQLAFVGGTVFVYTRTGTTWTEQAQLVSSDPEVTDGFAGSVSLDGDTLAAGARSQDGAETNSGAAYVFVRNGTAWSEQARLEPSDPAAFDLFGWDLDLDGDTLVCSSPLDDHAGGANAGSAYIFVRSGTLWTEQAKLVASDAGVTNEFGEAVTLDGDTAVVGATGGTDPGVYVFVRSGTTWSQQTKLVTTKLGRRLGYKVALDGDTLVANSVNGDAFVYVRSGTVWSEEARIEHVADSMELSGNLLILGDSAARAIGSAVVFQRVGTTWSLVQELIPDAPNTEFSNAVAVNGKTVFVASDIDTYAYELDVLQSPSFCDASDGALASCPCGNAGTPDSGCDIPHGTGGVDLQLVAQETSPLNRATLSSSGYPVMSNPTSVLLRAPTLDPSSPVVFGDGLRCVGIPVVRLDVSFANNGAASHTFGHGAMAGPGAHYYQLWLRSNPVMFCTPESFNLSQGRKLTW